jgi:hypothetical protein
MNSTPVPWRRCSLQHQLQDLLLGGDVERGGRLVGDQQRPGSQASAMAIMMRWRWPPESWCG